jgi:hypothetical protein
MVTNSKMLNDDGLHLIHKTISFGDKSASGNSSIPVITSARASPPPLFLAEKQKH